MKDRFGSLSLNLLVNDSSYICQHSWSIFLEIWKISFCSWLSVWWQPGILWHKNASSVCPGGMLHFLGRNFPHQNLLLPMGTQQNVPVQLDWTHIMVLSFLPVVSQGEYINILFCSNAETHWITWCLGLFLEFLTCKISVFQVSRICTLSR